MAKAASDPDGSTNDDDPRMAAFWEQMDGLIAKHGGITDERLDAAMDRWLAKNSPEGDVGGGPGSAPAGAGASPARGSAGGGAGAAEPANPRAAKPSGGSFFDVLSRVALGKSQDKPAG